MNKQSIDTIHEKNVIIDNIIDALQSKQHFLLLGHVNPDEDCIASMVAFALIVSKFSKKATVYLRGKVHEHFLYLLNICTHNAIRCSGSIEEGGEPIDALVLCDTPKPSMIDAGPEVQELIDNPAIVRIEIDHHIGSDSRYFGDEGYRLVMEANSASELVGLIALKLAKRDDLLRRYNITTLLTRNIVLSVLTGIVGDTNMGRFIKSKREKRYYDIFSDLYNSMLKGDTIKSTNLTNKEDVFREIQRLSAKEEQCLHFILDKKKFSRSIGYVALNRAHMDYLHGEFDNETIVSVSRSIADHLAEESRRMGMVAYDDSMNTGLAQFRIRRGQAFKSFDLRRVLDIFSIDDGGGHEGAIGFRLGMSQVGDIETFVEGLVEGIENVIS